MGALCAAPMTESQAKATLHYHPSQHLVTLSRKMFHVCFPLHENVAHNTKVPENLVAPQVCAA